MPSEVPFWEGVRLGDSVAVTASTFPEFDDESRTDRVFTSYATARGELFIHQWTDHCPARYRIAFDVKVAFSANVRILADGAGDWYINVNGAVSNYTAAQDLTLSFRAGRNVVTIFKQDAETDRFLLEGILFDGENAVWIPPNRSR